MSLFFLIVTFKSSYICGVIHLKPGFKRGCRWGDVGGVKAGEYVRT